MCSLVHKPGMCKVHIQLIEQMGLYPAALFTAFHLEKPETQMMVMVMEFDGKCLFLRVRAVVDKGTLTVSS